MKSLAATLALLLLIGCNKPTAAPARGPAPAPVSKNEPPPAPLISGLPYTFTVKQRSQNAIPDSELVLLVDDITRGAVLISLQTKEETFLQPVFVKEHDRKGFEYLGRQYELVLTKLDNALVGEDFATFELQESPRPGDRRPESLSEQQKIDRLIAKIESLADARFIRNGAEHTPAEAAKHLREKRDHAGEQLKSAEQFIEQVASRSSLSGEEYEIRFPDGRTVKSGEFLRRELKSLNEPAPSAVAAP